jgi:CRISPR-associated endonuclease/helicase Cas3
MAIVIARHCVAQDPVTGLSPLQRALLDDPHPVRIADAPTGAGKSYAFQYALAQHQQRILFIVPTRRLAQNLAAGLARDLIEKARWPAALAEAKVALWSSDATEQLKEQGVMHIGGHRLRQIQGLDDTREGGEMIVAIPEVVSQLLLRKRLEARQADKGIFDLLANFEHIVFDEFHTIEPRGFGLAAVCAKLAAGFP